jgi:hypothetical protein
MSRYSIEGPWELAETLVLNDGYAGESYVLGKVETATLVDGTGGYRYEQGAYRVTSKVPGIRTKTFRGESAWSNAARYADDVYEAARRELLAKGELTLRS